MFTPALCPMPHAPGISQGCGLTRGAPVEADAILAAMAHDKKKQGRALRWVLPRAVGEVEITADVPLQVVRSVLCGMGARSEP